MRVKRLGNTIYGRDLGELRSGTSGDKFVSVAWVVDKDEQQERPPVSSARANGSVLEK